MRVVVFAHEHHVQGTGFDFVDVDPVKEDAAQGRARSHGTLDQPDDVGAPKSQVPERPVGLPETVEHQFADVLDGQALEGREQAGRVMEQFHVAYRDPDERCGPGQTGRRQRHEPATGQRQVPDGRQQRGILIPEDQQLRTTK